LESLSGGGNGDESYLAGLQEQFIGTPLINRCVPMYEDFRGIASYYKWQRRRADKKDAETAFDVASEKKHLLESYTKDDLRFVLSQLDMEFELTLGYDYGYIYELLESEENGI